MATALILAAGKATRLEGIRDCYAKANVPIGDTTPLRFLLHALGTQYSDIWINLHFKGEQVREQAERFVAPGVHLRFLEETALLGTGGTLLELMNRGADLPDLMVNAKMFTDFKFASLVQAPPSSLVLHPASCLSTFGGLSFDAEHRIQGLCRQNQTPPDGHIAAVFTGICKPSAEWLPHLKAARESAPDDTLCSIRHGLLPALKSNPGHARAILHDGTWCEISTPERVREAERQLALL